jgi:DNA-binding CsgD family transcriptional regulator
MTIQVNPTQIGLQHFLAQIMEAAETGQCLLSGEGAVVFSNPRARSILADGDGLSVDTEQKLVIDTPRDAARWEEILQIGVGRLLITRLSGAHPYRAHLFPLVTEDAAVRLYRFLLVLHDPANAPAHSVQAIQELYRLTDAETQVLQALAAGKSVEEIATQRGNAPATVRTQLKALYRKTNTSRQAELLRLVLPAA